MSPDQVRVLVLYSHPLMGEGLGRMLEAEPGVAERVIAVSRMSLDEGVERLEKFSVDVDVHCPLGEKSTGPLHETMKDKR